MESVRRYVDEVLALPAVAGIGSATGPVAVRARRAVTAAHYESRGGMGVIAVPDKLSATWAMRELVVSFGHFTAVDADRPLPTKGMALGALRQGIRFSTRIGTPCQLRSKDGGDETGRPRLCGAAGQGTRAGSEFLWRTRGPTPLGGVLLG